MSKTGSTDSFASETSNTGTRTGSRYSGSQFSANTNNQIFQGLKNANNISGSREMFEEHEEHVESDPIKLLLDSHKEARTLLIAAMNEGMKKLNL